MKVLLSVVVAVAALIACSHALPAKKRIVYYQQPSAAASLVATPHRMMYLQYVQPARSHARSHQAAAALVAGESVATGTYLRDCDHPESDTASGESTQQDVSSVAEAYPASAEEEEAVQAGELPLASDDDAKVPRDYHFEQPEDVAVEAEPSFVANLPAPKPIAPVATPTKTYLPPAAPQHKRKVIVELEQASEEEANDDLAGEYDSESSVAASEEEQDDQEEEVAEDDDTAVVVPVAPKKPSRRTPVARRPAAPKKPAAKPKAKPSPCVTCAKAKNPAPQGTFFPIDFGGTNGGAIAIANSFSTGEGGSATSHAIAYGSPNPASRSRFNASKRH